MMCKLPTQCRIQICCIVAAVFAALVGALFNQHLAHAQGGENDYVDVALILEVPDYLGGGDFRDLDIIVVNHGARTAYDVEVEVDLVTPGMSHFYDTVASSSPLYLNVPVGKASLHNNERTFRWSIPALGGLQREEFAAKVFFKSTSSPIFDKSLYVHEHFGEVTTTSFESDRHKGNNSSRVWSYNYNSAQGRQRQVAGNYSVAVSVDKLSPSQGDTVKFTITTDREDPYPGGRLGGQTSRPVDLKVDIELTDGLTVSGAPSYVSTDHRGTVWTKPDSVSYGNGVFNVGTLKTGEAGRNSVTLPVTVASSAVVNEQCLTATLTGNPPPGIGPYDDDISDNEAKLCLGTAPERPLLHSQVNVFNIYPCVGNTNPPCGDSDDVRVRAVKTAGPSEEILRPGRVLVQIQDRPSRKYDSHTNSVNGGNIASWQVPVTWDPSEINPVHAQWSNLRDAFTASGTSGGAPPGKVHIRAYEGETFEIIYKMTSATGWTGEDTVGYNPGASGSQSTFNAEFEKLGTYKLQYTAKLTRTTRRWRRRL